MPKKYSLNPALKGLQVLVGNWVMELSNASFLPDPKTVLRGSASIEWIEDGDYLVVRQGVKGVAPYATWVIGRDDDTPDYTVLYSDDRRFSRVYGMSFKSGVWKIWRNTAKFTQRFTGKMSKDKSTIKGYWEKSTNGKKWHHDFDITYKKK